MLRTTRQLSRFICDGLRVNNTRTLFSPSALGVDIYEQTRKVELLYTPHIDTFKKDFKKQIDESVPLYILVPNFKKYINLIDNVDEDITLLWRATRLLNTERERWLNRAPLDDRTDFCFGPVIMRAFSHLRLPVVAKEFFKSDLTANLFDRPICYRILLDLLFDERMYGELLECYAEIVKRTATTDYTVCSSVYAIVAATYYRLNNRTHDDQAIRLYDEMKTKNILQIQFRRTLAILAAIRLKQKEPDECLKMLSPYDDFDVTIRYVRLLAHLELNEFQEVFRLLRLTIEPPTARTQTVPKMPDQMLQLVGTKVTSKGTVEEVAEYKSLCSDMRRLNRIMFKSIAGVLCSRFPSNIFGKNVVDHSNRLTTG